MVVVNKDLSVYIVGHNHEIMMNNTKVGSNKHYMMCTQQKNKLYSFDNGKLNFQTIYVPK